MKKIKEEEENKRDRRGRGGGGEGSQREAKKGVREGDGDESNLKISRDNLILN